MVLPQLLLVTLMSPTNSAQAQGPETPAYAAGVTIANTSPVDPLVILKHFGPENPELVADRAALTGLRRGA